MRCDVYMPLLAVFSLLLARSGERNRLVLSSPVSGRSQWQTRNVVGPFERVLTFAIEIEWQKTFREFIRSLERITLDAPRGHGDTSEATAPARFSFERRNLAYAIERPNLHVVVSDVRRSASSFELTLLMNASVTAAVYELRFLRNVRSQDR